MWVGWLATASADGTARIWDAATGAPSATLAGHVSAPAAMAIAPDGGWLATVAQDRTVRVFDTAAWHVLAMIRVDNTIGTCAWLGEAGLVVGGDAGTYVFDFLTGAARPSEDGNAPD